MIVNNAKNSKLFPWQKEALAQACTQAQAVEDAGGAEYPKALTPVTVAQFLLESSWGKRGMQGNNYFGMKATGDEPSISLPTREVIQGESHIVIARFRSFSSMEECFAAHAALIMHGKRADQPTLIYAEALKHPNDPRAFANALTGVYATDPLYGSKLISIMEDRGLIPTPEVTD